MDISLPLMLALDVDILTAVAVSDATHGSENKADDSDRSFYSHFNFLSLLKILKLLLKQLLYPVQ